MLIQKKERLVMANKFLVIIVILVAAIVVALIISVYLNIFLSNEMQKKFSINTKFADYEEKYVQVKEWTYLGDKGPGMETMVFRSPRPFAMQIGLRLNVSNDDVDYYGFVIAHPDLANGGYSASISTYLGGDPVRFILMAKGTGEISINFDNTAKPDAVYPPHPWQPFGDYWRSLLKTFEA